MNRTDEDFMAEAIALARQGSPSPNPHVGAVVVDPATGSVMGRGFHPRRGQAHAEIMALQEAGAAARGATLYVTLEPCNHHGRTPPCTEAILAAGVSRVVVGVRDPNPHVEGHGHERLEAAGIAVTVGVGAEECERIIAPWTKHLTTGRPWVRLKVACSVDGRIAAAPSRSPQVGTSDTPSGISRWITGPEARARGHRLRRQADAVLVGIETALSDDPQLTARDAPTVEGRADPIRVVVDSRARLPLDTVLVRTAREVPTWCVVGPDADPGRCRDLAAAGVVVVPVARGEDGLDWHAVLRALGERDVVELLVEGGGRVAGSLIEGQHVDELWAFLAPIVLGAEGTPAFVGPRPLDPMALPRAVTCSVETLGPDVLWVLRWPGSPVRRSVEKGS